jgi:autotransporter-associated beta strand protein
MKIRRNRFVACSLVLLSLSQFAHAATGTWSGATNGTWDSTETNWNFDPAQTNPWDNTNGPNNTANFNLASLAAPVSGDVYANGITFNTGGIVTAGGTIHLAGTTPTLSAASGVTGTLRANLDGTLGFIKTGPGTIGINPSTANSLTGDVQVNSGQLVVQPNADVAAIANTATLSMNGGSLSFLGSSSGTNPRSQTFAGTTISSGHSAISVNDNGSASTDTASPTTLTLGTVSRSAGATVNLAYTGVQTTAERRAIQSSSWTAGGAILDSGVAYASLIAPGTGASSSPTSPRAGNHWAATDASGNVISATYTASDPTTLAGNANVAAGIDTVLAADAAITSLRFGLAEARTITATGFTLTTGGILVSSAVGSSNVSNITGGTLRSAAGLANKDLVIFQNNTQDLVIGSQITNAAAGDTGLTKSGTGRLSLTSNSNNYTGETRINEGILRIGTGGSTGALSTSSAIVNNATLQFDRSAGMVQGTHFSSSISGTGGLGVERTTTVTLNSASNTFSGGVSIPADGVLKLSHGAALGSGTLSIGNGNGNSHTARLELTNNISVPNAIALNGRSTSTSDGIRNVSGNNTLPGTITQFAGGGTGYIQSDSGLLTLGTAGGTAVTPASSVPSGRTLVLRGAGDGLVAGDLVNYDPAKTLTLIKDGAGTWTLSGNNTYTGDTTVLDGTLVITQDDVLDDNATVTLASTASLNLTHAGIDVVGALIIDGVAQDDGKYTFGSGQLQVGPDDGTPFSIWAAENITAIDPGADASAGGDPDNDGSNNLAEFAFNGDPLSGSDNGQVYVLTADSDADPDTDKELILTLAVRKSTPAFAAGAPATAPLTDGVIYSILGGTDLASFGVTVTPVGLVDPGVPLTDATHYEYRSFSLSGSNGLAGKGFLRAKAEAP